MIKRFFLPDHSGAFRPLINSPRRCGFDGLRDPGEGKEFSQLIVNHWRKDYMHVIGHDRRHVEFISTAMIVKTGRKHDVSSDRWQDPAKFRDESDEMRREVLLQMRQVAPIEPHEWILPRMAIAGSPVC